MPAVADEVARARMPVISTQAESCRAEFAIPPLGSTGPPKKGCHHLWLWWVKLPGRGTGGERAEVVWVSEDSERFRVAGLPTLLRATDSFRVVRSGRLEVPD